MHDARGGRVDRGDRAGVSEGEPAVVGADAGGGVGCGAGVVPVVYAAVAFGRACEVRAADQVVYSRVWVGERVGAGAAVAVGGGGAGAGVGGYSEGAGNQAEGELNARWRDRFSYGGGA